MITMEKTTPALLLLPGGGGGDDVVEDGCLIFSLEEKRSYTIKNICKSVVLGKDSWCFGSSHGWLVLLEELDEESRLFLFNPFSSVRIQPPMMNSLQFGYAAQSIKYIVEKAILLSDPSSDKNFGVVIIYKNNISSRRLAFWKNGDSRWHDFSESSILDRQSYCDVICNNNTLYALSDYSVEEWDFRGNFPVKKRTITPVAESPGKYDPGLFAQQGYLVESGEDILVVMRYIGHFVNDQGKAVFEPSPGPSICPYKTMMFHVYKLADLNDGKLEEVENLNDRVLFLGGNHSFSLSAQDFPACESNSIYFTDDNWSRMEEEDFYGGHDVGVFSLQNKTVQPFYQGRIMPPPFWIVPNPRTVIRA